MPERVKKEGTAMTSETLFRLVELFEKGSIARLAFSQGDCRLELEKPAPAAAALPAAPGAPAPAPAAAEEKADEGETIASPPRRAPRRSSHRASA